MAFDGEKFVERFNTQPWGARVIGREAVREFLHDMFERIPDVRWDELRHFACPDLAVVEWVTTGTPRGAGRYETHGCDILSLRDGKISTKRSYRKASL